MILKEHKGKHTNLTRPDFGIYSRNEIAFVGGTCEAIKHLAGKVITALSVNYRCAYVDSIHEDNVTSKQGQLANGATLEFTAHSDHQQLDYGKTYNQFSLRETFAFTDIVLVNGNHHQAEAQIVIIDKKKQASLQKRVEQLNNVKMLLLADGSAKVFEFIKEAIPNWQQLPICSVNDTDKIISFINNDLISARPVLNGLVLAGGKSQRMGFDKVKIDWHGKQQRYYAADLLKKYCDQVYISCRADQKDEIGGAYKSLPDTFVGLGPYGGILSAFREQPDCAWLVIACDLPLLEEKILTYLVSSRKVASIATAYQSTFNEFPEPLITIWEPKSYPVLLSFLAQGYSCPRKVLINSDVTILQVPEAAWLTNVNTPEDFEKVKQVLNHKLINNES